MSKFNSSPQISFHLAKFPGSCWIQLLRFYVVIQQTWSSPKAMVRLSSWRNHESPFPGIYTSVSSSFYAFMKIMLGFKFSSSAWIWLQYTPGSTVKFLNFHSSYIYICIYVYMYIYMYMYIYICDMYMMDHWGGVLVATGNVCRYRYISVCHTIYYILYNICMYIFIKVNEIVRQRGEIFWVTLGGFHPKTYWGDVSLASLSFTQMTMSGLAGYFKNQFPTTNDTQMPRKAQGFQSHCNWESGLWIPASLAKSSSSHSLSIVPVQIFSSSGSGGMAKLSLEKWKNWKIAWFWMEFKTNLNAVCYGAWRSNSALMETSVKLWWQCLTNSVRAGTFPLQNNINWTCISPSESKWPWRM